MTPPRDPTAAPTPSPSVESGNPCPSVVQTPPPGYKLTEVGVIPEDWEVSKLGNCLVGKPRYGINAPAVPYSDKLPVYIRITDITDDGRFSKEGITSVECGDQEKYSLRMGDLVFARTGASVGKSYFYNPDDGRLVFAGFLIRIKPNPTVLDPRFLSAYVQTARYWDWVGVMSMRSGQPGINGTEYAQLLVPLPPLHEQHAIAEVLSDVDALLAALERLIAKKRAIKQGAMQQLLTGQERLPGFGHPWKSKTLGEVLDYEQPSKYLVEDTKYTRTGIPVLTAGKTFILGYTDEREGIYTNLPVIVFDDFTTASRYVNFPFKVKSSAIKLLTEKEEEVDLRFIFEKLQILAFTLGDHKRYYISEYQNLAVKVPPLPEQRAIAEVLSDMDAEIAALEAQREKTRAIKQGMMQELLTGRIRLIENG